MNREEMLGIVREQITAHRYQHTLGVMECAIQLAKIYGADVQKAEVAAIFHDYAKFRDIQEMEEIIRNVPSIPLDLLEYDKELYHAPVGAYLVEHEVGIKDPEILDAIAYHTTGRPQMSVLEKVVCLADYIEPGRHFPGVDEVRELAMLDLDQALAKSLENTMRFLEKKGQVIYPLTRGAYLSLTGEKKEKRTN
ncbi:bis(5'-nucleosyl)-tetraphosphatase (symmetrical) YqeK [Caldalkalibacillus mannanilyticus]|uniref:bis(5'-nucleosyl)-tetraphosphatase (symmetrical) YqeK n=1 Tax=Caldalkalibacillus mannanilyticus TaxID=1418 RepID=UPI00046A1897|nr:bis(5'-nucleosyl)-tetraphosphatase (symmetrical) YqeK [Caldalkalibacillus mannanilyticus]